MRWENKAQEQLQVVKIDDDKVHEVSAQVHLVLAYLPTYLPIYLSIDRSIDLSIYRSIYPSIHRAG
jgi:hypothetical protein